MNRSEWIPKDTKKVWDFNQKFDFQSDILLLMPDGGFSIGDYEIPDEVLSTVSKEYFTDLIHKSLADNHDYVLDFAKKHGKEIVYEKGCIY